MTENIIYLIIFIIGLILGTILYRLIRRVKRLQAEREGLWRQLARLKNDRSVLEEKLRKYTGVKTKIALTLPEKRIMLSALEDSGYKGTITNPKTKRFIRMIYNSLREKVKDSIKQECMGNYG